MRGLCMCSLMWEVLSNPGGSAGQMGWVERFGMPKLLFKIVNSVAVYAFLQALSRSKQCLLG